LTENLFFQTNSTQVLTKHIAKEHDKAGPQFKCMICEVKFYLKGYLTSHMISHGEKTFKCPHCDHSSGYKNHLEDHIRFVHNKEKPFKCSKCPKAYSTKVMLVGHVSSFHEGKLNHKCKQCSYASGYIPNLTRHVQKYHQQKRYECPTCGLKMTEAGSLKEHIRKIHEDPEARPFECVICSKMFKCRTALYSHSKLHLNAKRKCDLCGFESIHLDIVNIHKRRVHQNVFFECDICHAKLITVANLRRHVREVHLMDRPKNVICDFCNYRCRFKSTMKNHLINNHIDGAKYPTTICTKEVKIILKDILTQVEFNKS
jgi:KRAB domain-containing zinc finger protein